MTTSYGVSGGSAELNLEGLYSVPGLTENRGHVTGATTI